MIILAHAAVGWALCFATIGMAMAFLPLDVALTAHAIRSTDDLLGCLDCLFQPLRLHHTAPDRRRIRRLRHRRGFPGTFILPSLDMLASPLGTWIPFALIFTSTWLTALSADSRVSATAQPGVLSRSGYRVYGVATGLTQP